MGRFERMLAVRGWAVPLLLEGALVPAAFAAPANLHTVTPCRVFDSRQPADGPALSSGTARTINVGGVCGVPANASSAAVNVTVIAPSSLGYLRVYAAGPAPLPFSAINFSAGQTRGNNAIVQLSVGGQVDAQPTMPAPGTVHLVLDVFGYFLDDASPTAVDDSPTVNEDALATTIDVLANDTDPDGGPIAVSSVTPPANGTGVITNGGADLTYQPAPDYCNAPPGTTPDTFTYTLSPGGSTATVSVTVTCVNDAPVLGGSGTVAFTEDGPPVTVATALTAEDVDDTNLESATVMISNLLDTGFEILAVDTTGTAIVASYSAPNLTLTGTDTVANYELVLRRVTYENTSGNPDNVPRFVAFVAHDGTVAGNILVATVLVNTSNDSPVLTAGGGSPTFTEDGPAVAVDPGLVVTDADDVNLESAGVAITNLLDAGQEVLAATTAGTSIAANYLAPILTLSGSDTLANYQAVLRSVTYANNSQDPTPTPRSISFIASDGTASSNTPTTSLSVVSVIDAPVLTAGGGSPVFTEDGAAVAVDPALSVTDQDDTNLESATATITNLLNAGAEVLAASTGGTAIVASYVAPTLTLTGSDTLASYQAVLRSVTYLNSSQNPGTTARTIAFQADDGTASSNVVNKSLAVVAVNDAPTLDAIPDPAAILEDAALQTVNLSGITAGGGETQTLSVTATSGNPGLIPNPTVTYTSPNAAGSLSYAPVANQNGTAIITVTVMDNGGTANGGVNTFQRTFTVNVTAVNDPPVALPKNGGNVQANMRRTAINASLLTGVTDVDNGVNGCVSTSFSVASITSSTGGLVTGVNLGAGTFDFEPTAGFTGTATVFYTVSDTGCPGPGAASAAAAISLTVTGPVIWFVDGATGNDANSGNLGSALATLAAATGKIAANPNQRIFVYSGTYAQGATLNQDGWLIGQGVSTAGFDAIMGITPPSGTIARPQTRSDNGTLTRPQLGATVTAHNNSNVRGLNLVVTGATQGLAASGRSGIAVSDLGVTSVNGNAVNLTNTSASFANNLSIAVSGSGMGFSATGGGTVTATQDNVTYVNTITSTSGTALNVSGTTIGASGLTFRSISAGNATAAPDPVSGIILGSTGTAVGDGGLTVTGDGVNTTLGGNGSGGTIQNTTAAGAALNSTKNVNLNYMTITNPGTDGIAVTNISGFVLNRSTISDASGTGPYDATIDFNNYSNGDPSITPTAVNGAISIINSLIGPASGSSPHNTVTAVVGSGTSDWTVSGTTIRNTGNSGINLEARNSAVLTTFTVSGSAFAGANVAGGTGSPSARGLFANNLEDSIIGLMKIENNTFTNNNIHIDLNQQNDTDPIGSHTFVVRNNTMTGSRSHAMNVFAAAGSFGGAFTGTIQNNAIGNASVDGSGSEIGNGIRVNMNGGTDGVVLIDSNDIFETPNGRGIEVIGRNGLGRLDITITNNVVDHYNLTYPIGGGAAAFPLGAIYVNAAKGGATGIVGFTVRADVRLNTVPTAGGPLPAASEVTGTYLAVVESVGSETGGILQLVDSPAGPGGQTPTQQLQSTNTGDAGANAGVSLITGPINVPPVVPLLFAPGGVESSPESTRETPDAVGRTPALRASVSVLTQSDLDSLVAAAFERWKGAGLNADQLAALKRLTFEAADLPGGYLGETSGTRIRLDNNAGGHGWFTGFAAEDDAYFGIEVATTRCYADPANAPAGRIDLLTAVLHEMGHALGLEDTHAEQDRDSVMYGFLTKGERRVPSPGQGSLAKPTPGR